MEDSKRTRRVKKRGGRILRLLLLMAIVILGFQIYQLGILKELGGLIKEAASGKAQEVIQNGKNVWDSWTGTDSEGETETPEMENERAWQNSGEEVLLDCVYLNQKELGYLTGCEAVTAVMALQTAGLEISVEEFMEAMPQGELYQKDGKTYGPDPNQVFVGNPLSKSGYGCFAPVILETVEKLLAGGRSGLEIRDLTGSSLEELKEQLNQGNPVILWASSGMGTISYRDSWLVEGRSTPYFWPRGEHCLLLTGYQGEYLFFNDPSETEAMAYSTDQVAAPYEELGRQALVIVPG